MRTSPTAPNKPITNSFADKKVPHARSCECVQFYRTEHHKLYSSYMTVVQFYEGRGRAGQVMIDKAFAKLQDFENLHPEVSKTHRVTAYDDGLHGLKHDIQTIMRRRLTG